MMHLITISRVSCLIFLLCFLYRDSKLRKSALLCFDDTNGGVKITSTIRSSHSSESTSQFLDVNEAPCCSSPWKQCSLSSNVQLMFTNISALLEYPFEPLLFKVRNKCFENGICRDDIWYSLNNFKQPTVSQSVDITVSVKTSNTETQNSGKIYVKSSSPLNFSHRGAHKFIARLRTPPPVDLGPCDPVLSIDDKFLLVPEINSKVDLEHRQMKNGSSEYLVVNQNLFTLLEKKYLTKINQVFSVLDPEHLKYLEAISQNINEQPFDFWLHDRIQQLLGKPTKYFLSSYGKLATNQTRRRKTVSFLMDQDLVVDVTILPSNALFPSDHIQLTVKHGILMTLLGTISDPYPAIDSICDTISVTLYTCRDALTSILSCLCNILTDLYTVASEFVGHYDDDTIYNKIVNAWDATTVIFRNGRTWHTLIVFKTLLVCLIAIMSWSLFSQKHHPDDSAIQPTVSYPPSVDINHTMEETLLGVNNRLTYDTHVNYAGANLVVSLSETSISSDSSDVSWTSCKSFLCQYPQRLDEVTPPDEDESDDDSLDDRFCPYLSRLPFLDDCLSECSEPFSVMSLPDEDLPTIIPDTPDEEEADDNVVEELVQYEIAKRAKPEIQYMKLMKIWASEVCLLKGFYISPYWQIMQHVVPVNKIKHTIKPKIGTSAPDNEPCALATLAELHTIVDLQNIPTFGQWIFSAKINPYWAFQNHWPAYTWSTSYCLPVISGTLMRGLPRRDVIYFPGGFIAPCRAVNYRTEPLAYQS